MKRLFKINIIACLLFATAGFSQAELIDNGSFENGWVDADIQNRYDYGPSDADGELAWGFRGGAGLSESNTAWNGIAESGENFAFLQHYSTIHQDFTLKETGALTLDFSWAARAGFPASQNLQVKIDNYFVFDITTDTYGWTQESITLGNLSAGTYTLSFSTIPAGTEDQSVFIDSVSLVSTEFENNLSYLQDSFPVSAPISIFGGLAMFVFGINSRRKAKSL